MDAQDKNRTYRRCRVYGEGEIIDEGSGHSSETTIEDMSGAGALISTKMQLEIGSTVRLALAFGGHTAQRTMSFKGTVKRLTNASAAGNSYGIHFMDLTDPQKAEIDEVMRLSCHSGEMPDCGDHSCVFRNRAND